MRGRVVVRPASLSFAAQMVDFCHLRVNAGDVLQLKQQYRGKEMLFRGCTVDPPMATLLPSPSVEREMAFLSKELKYYQDQVSSEASQP